MYNEKSLLDQIKNGKTKKEWPPVIRAFALTVHFYSPRAYDYIRKVFFKKLPASSTMRKWYQASEPFGKRAKLLIYGKILYVGIPVI